MTAPEREALAGRARAQAIDLRACNALPRHHRDTQDEIDAAADILDEIAALIEAFSSPAVTVTEERCRAVYREACSGYEQAAWGDEDLAISAMLTIASEAALKSTTPQTGSQE